jgi:hypothetical protein
MMVDVVENKVVIGANVNIKNAFDAATKNFAEYFKTTDQFWKNATQRIKEQDEAAKKMAHSVAGKNKESIAGAFDAAAAGLTGFSVGFVAGAREEVTKSIVDTVEKMVTAYADRETAENRLRASMHLTNEQLKTLFEQLHEFGPTVGKFPEQLAAEWDYLASTNNKLIDSFQPLQMFGTAVKADWNSVVALAQQATIAGVKPADMPAYLDKAAQALMRTGQRGVAASTMVSENFSKRGLQGAELQKQVAVIVSGLTPAFQNNPIAAANAMTEFMDPILEQKGNDSRMDNWIDRLKKGKVTLIQFFDEAFRRNDPSSQDFYRKLQADPRTRDLIKAWETQRGVIHELWQTEPTPLKDLAIFSESTEHELHRLAESLHELAVVVGGMSDAIEVIKALVAIVNDFTRKIKELKVDVDAIKDNATFSKAWEIYKDLWAISPAGMQWSTGKWLWNKAFPPAAAPPGGPGKPVRFTGSDDTDFVPSPGPGAMEPGLDPIVTDQQMLGALMTLSAHPAATGDIASMVTGATRTMMAARGIGAFGGDNGPGGGTGDTLMNKLFGGLYTPGQGYPGSSEGRSRETQRAMDALQSMNDAEVHSMAMPGPGRRGAAFTPGAGESPWPMSAGVPAGDWGRGLNLGPAGGSRASAGGGAGGGGGGGSGAGGGVSPSAQPSGPSPDIRPPPAPVDPPISSIPLPRPRPTDPGPGGSSEKIKVTMDIEPPPRWQLERAARYTDQIGNRFAERDQQARGAGQIGFA